MAVRTKQLASGRLTTSSLVVVYTVPAGETTIIKAIDVTNLSTTVDATVVVGVDAGSFDNTLYIEDNLGFREQRHYERWLVLPPGASVALQGPGTPAVNYWISGTELEGVAD